MTGMQSLPTVLLPRCEVKYFTIFLMILIMKQMYLRICTTLLIIFSFFIFPAYAEQAVPPKVDVGNLYSKNPVLITIDGKAVHLEDIRDKKTHALTLQLYQHLQTILPEYALKQLQKNHKDISPTPEVTISEKEIRDFYELNNLQAQGTLKDYTPKIKQFMTQRRHALIVAAQYQDAIKKGWVTSHIEAPSDYLTSASASTAALRGNEEAKVMLLEFSDYQCPFCKRIQPTIKALIEKYGDRVVFGYRHFPLPFHKEADEAAIAAECAREQGKFEPMHQFLYQNQRAQQMKYLRGYGRKFKIKNLDQYDKCLSSEKYRSRVNQDIADGQAIGINGTPGFVIGRYDPISKTVRGEMLSGAQPADSFEKLIIKYLE